MLTPEIRKAIYGIFAAVVAALTVFQVIDEDQSKSLLDVADQVLAVLVSLLAFRNVNTNPGV